MLHLLMSGLLTLTDACIKNHREENDNTYSYLDDKVKIITYRNKGAFLGKGENKPFVVTVISVILTMLLSVVFVITLTTKGSRALRTGLSLILGGAFSNTYDRLKKGYVVDYIVFSKAPGFIKNVVFNISDFAIIIGSLIMALH